MHFFVGVDFFNLLQKLLDLPVVLFYDFFFGSDLYHCCFHNLQSLLEHLVFVLDVSCLFALNSQHFMAFTKFDGVIVVFALQKIEVLVHVFKFIDASISL